MHQGTQERQKMLSLVTPGRYNIVTIESLFTEIGPMTRAHPNVTSLFSSRKFSGTRSFFGLGLFALALISGCGFQQKSMSVPNAFLLTGAVLGGQKPISNSLVRLYAVDANSVSNPELSSSTRADQAGVFFLSVTKPCPSPDSLVYLIANGGNPGLGDGINNSAIELMAALGRCQDLGSHPYVTINEVTTVGSILPLASYARSSTQIGPEGGDTSQYQAALEDIDALIDVTTGSLQSTTLSPEDDSQVLKVNALANVLSSCVVSRGGAAFDGSTCGKLFSLTGAPSSAPPATTLSAALAIGQYPSQNVASLFALSAQSAHFQPTLTVAPPDWRLNPIRFLAAPVVSPTSGTYASGQMVTIVERARGAIIYYTTDGSAPTEASTVYAASITLSHSETVRAIAHKGMLRSLLEGSATYNVSLPPVSITVAPGVATLRPLQAQQFNASVENATNMAVSWTLSPSVGSLSSTGLYTAPATFTLGQSVTVTATSAADATKNAKATVALVAPLPTQLAFVTEPSDAVAGMAIAPGVSVVAEDASGNPVTGAALPITLTIGSNPGAATLQGTNVATSGVFGQLVVSQPGSGYTLMVSSPGLTAAVSTAFNVAPAGSTPVTPASGELAVSAKTFTNTVGINIHLTNGDTLYMTNFPLVLSSLKDLGITHVRDGLVDFGSGPSDYYTKHQTLGANGISGDFITNLTESAALIQAYPARVGNMEAVEAPNEYDTSGDPNWAANLSQYLGVLHGAVYGAQPMTGIDLFGPSLVNPNWYAANNSYATLGAVSNYFDQGNLHNYFGGRNPGTPGWTPQGYGSINFAMNAARSVWPAEPLVTTETGYYDDSTIAYSLPDAYIAKYMPRVLLEQYMHGIQRTYLYELADNQYSGGSYGLLRADGSQKPAYVALQSLMRLLADPGSGYTTAQLQYGLAGAAADVHHLLLQRRDGTYLLALWIEEPSFDVNAQAVLPVPSRQMAINFVNPADVSAIYQWQADGSRTVLPAIAGKTNVPVVVSDQLLVVQFTMP